MPRKGAGGGAVFTSDQATGKLHRSGSRRKQLNTEKSQNVRQNLQLRLPGEARPVPCLWTLGDGGISVSPPTVRGAVWSYR